jgi:hypothetical protein
MFIPVDAATGERDALSVIGDQHHLDPLAKTER